MGQKIKKPSEKQLNFIEDIEIELNVFFEGNTFEEAQEWIEQNIEAYRYSKKGFKEEYDYWNDAE